MAYRFAGLLLVVVAALLALLVPQADAVCCKARVTGTGLIPEKRCYDDHILGTTEFCCGKGSCNVFCCNCDGGCRD